MAFLKLADVKMKKELADQLSTEDKQFLEDCLPGLTIQIDDYRIQELLANGKSVSKSASNGRSYISADSQKNFEDRIRKSGKADDGFEARAQKDREFGKIGELSIQVED